jgi:hypothetical protein
MMLTAASCGPAVTIESSVEQPAPRDEAGFTELDRLKAHGAEQWFGVRPYTGHPHALHATRR